MTGADALADSLRGIDVPAEARHVTSADGTRVATFKLGDGPVAWVMAPAMGAPLLSMKRVIEPLARLVSVYTWDMRGFYASDAPRDPRAYGVEDHIADLDATMRAWGVGEHLLGGWSMGVQLSLERHHRAPERVLGLVLINGPYERALAAVAPLVHPLLARSLALAPALAPALNAMSLRVLGAQGMAERLHAARLLAENPELFAKVLERFSRVDWGRYLTVTRHLHEHSAAAYLARVRVPALVTSGTRDLLTPPRVARRLHARLPGSELFIVERATHYAPIEFGEVLAERIESFVDRRVVA